MTTVDDISRTSLTKIVMEPAEGESNYAKDDGVKELQAALFPVEASKGTGSFLANFLLKSDQVQSEEGDDERTSKVKEVPSRESSTLQFAPQAPRWPTECQVLEERIIHIPYTPSIPEPYYVPTGKEVQPKPVGDDCGIIVYQYYPISAVNYFSRSSIGGSKYLLPTCPSPEEDSLHFESRFESGNLAKAIRITSSYYELYLRTDLYTNRHMQWFYFRITNMKKNFMYRFSIVNLFKDGSLYNEGMKPLMYSTKDSKLHSIGWRRCGDNITYFCNDGGNTDDSDSNTMYTLTFTLEFPHESDAVYLAHSYPYTYTDLQDYLVEMSHHPVKSTFSTLRLLCKTIAGNNVYFLTVTSPQEPGESKKKKAVVITARVHPGETPSSWMMKGIIDFLTSDCSPAKELRDNFIFKIVPMLNPDGVIVGNNRCSLNGRDLNRQYRTVIKESYPSIWYTKLMIRRLLEECGVAMYCDLHAHSRKHNIFIYGCENRRDADKHLHEQVFPLMLHKNAADKFSFENCKFHIHKCKEGTGRVVMWMMGVANSYTMEASFGGSTMGTRAETHFSPQDYEQMGRTYCQTLLDYFDDDPRKERLRVKIISRLVSEGSNADEPTNIRLSDYSSDDGDTSSSSDEDRDKEEDYMVPFLVPPPSPDLPKKQLKPKTVRSKNKMILPSPVATRKPLPLYTTVVGLDNLRSKSEYLSETSPDSESESDYATREKIKPVFRRRRKRKTATKKNLIAERSDSEIRPLKSLSVFDLIPPKNLRSLSWDRSPGVAHPKHFVDNRKTVVQQLSEVQTKLYALKKNRVWLGVGGGDVNAPLSWGSNHSSYLMKLNSAANQNRSCNKHIKKKSSKHEKFEKKCPKKKHKELEAKEKVQKKTQSGQQKKQFAEWVHADEIKLVKSKSLPSTSMIQRQKAVKSDEENTKMKKKKKRQRTVTKKRSNLKTVFKKRLRKTALLDVIKIHT